MKLAEGEELSMEEVWRFQRFLPRGVKWKRTAFGWVRVRHRQRMVLQTTYAQRFVVGADG